MSAVPELRQEQPENFAEVASDVTSDSKAPQPRSRRTSIVGVLQIAGVVVLVGLAIAFSRAPSGAVPGAVTPTAVAATPAQLVAVFKPAIDRHVLTVETTGSVVVRNHVPLATQVSGRVVAVSPSLRNGGTFKAGEELISIEARDFELAIAQANAEVASARANLMLREAESGAAISNYGILHPGKTVPPLVSKAPQIEQARAQIATALARQQVAATELVRTRFSLPFDGRVSENTAEIGLVLTKAQPFGRAFSLDAVEVATSIAAADLARITPAQGRRVTVRSGAMAFDGRIERVSAELDSRTRFAKLFIAMAAGNTLTPGSFVTVIVDGPALDGTMVLPEAARQVGGEIWVVADGAIAVRNPTVHGRTAGGMLVDAFDIGDGVITGSIPGGRAGLPVRVIEQAP